MRAARKEIGRLEKALERVSAREAELYEAMAASATDHARLGELQDELTAQAAERERLEAAWLQTAEHLEA
jgi:ATP-binding cassette subfamily F protein uup